MMMNIDEPLIYTGFPMSQMDENQIDLDREDIFFLRYSKIGLKIILLKILPYIGNTETGR